MGLQQMVVGDPQTGETAFLDGLDQRPVVVVERDHPLLHRQLLEGVLVLLDTVDPDFGAPAFDDFDMVAPVGRQIIRGKLACGGPKKLEALLAHPPTPDPEDRAVAVQLPVEVKTDFRRHHPEDSTSERGVLDVVRTGNAFTELHVEVNAFSAAGAPTNLDPGWSGVTDCSQIGIRDPNALCVRRDRIKIEPEVQRLLVPPVPTAGTNGVGVLVERIQKLGLVVPLRLGVRVLGHAKVGPRSNSVAVDTPLAGHKLASALGHVDLPLKVGRVWQHAVEQVG